MERCKCLSEIKYWKKNTREWCVCVGALGQVSLSVEASKEASPTVAEVVGIAPLALITCRESL